MATIGQPAAGQRDENNPPPRVGLALPEVSGMTLLDAALAYAGAGWFVLPVRPGTKNPGSVVGDRWPEQSSRDPDRIRRWWTENPDRGIALHVGRSGAVAFDLDASTLDVLAEAGRAEIAGALAGSGAIQGTRSTGDRGHYLFACAPDEFSNTAGGFAQWGEVRCANGVVIAPPTAHPDAVSKGGQYRQIRTGTLTPVPELLRAVLSEFGQPGADPLTDAELAGLLDAHRGDGCSHADCKNSPHGPVGKFVKRTGDGASRHDVMAHDVLPWAFREAAAGCYPAREAFDVLRAAWAGAFTDDDAPERRRGLDAEFAGMAAWAAGQARANPEGVQPPPAPPPPPPPPAAPSPPEDGAALLDDLLAVVRRYVVLPDDYAAVAVTLWIAATHALPAFECAPRLVVTSPDKRCGKTRLLDIVTGTVHRPLITVNATTAAVFRSIGAEHPPTLVIDEADTIFGTKRVAEQNEDLRALLNAGHQRGKPALRCVGPQQVPTPFPTFAMAAVAGIGAMPDTITDRAVNITMRRRKPAEAVAQFRSRRDGGKLALLQDRLTAWAAAHIDKLTEAEPDMPVEDRAADTWEPLVAVADAAGGSWPQAAREACVELVGRADAADAERSTRRQLLTDIDTVFADRGAEFIASEDMVAALLARAESPWQEFNLTPNKLSYRLRDFDVKPRHNADKSKRGYHRGDFADAFSRYIRPEPSEPSDTP